MSLATALTIIGVLIVVALAFAACFALEAYVNRREALSRDAPPWHSRWQESEFAASRMDEDDDPRKKVLPPIKFYESDRAKLAEADEIYAHEPVSRR